MKMLKIDGEVVGVITNEKLVASLNLPDTVEVVDLATDFNDAETGMVHTIEDYLREGYVVDGALFRVHNDKDVFLMVTGDGRAYNVGVD